MTARPLPRTPPPNIPGWTLLRAIGRGSYGEVWLARNNEGVFRAIKIVHRHTFDHERPYNRELSGIRRFEPVSRGHPSQVAIFSVDENAPEGFFYYVMELADDASGTQPFDPDAYLPKTLKSESARRGHLPYHECLEIGLALATALDHLHRHDLVHRDIKPSNVIFANGVPKLADIGLVTDIDATVSYVGTEGFLPPEGPGTPRADLYSLGKVLYEVATGQDRLEFPELPTLGSQDPRAASQLLELNQIFLKACQNDPTERYQSAQELIEDLSLLRAGRSLRELRALQVRLRRARLTVGAFVVLAALTSGVVYWRQQYQRHQRIQVERAARDAQDLAASMSADTTRKFANLYAASGMRLATNGDAFGALVFYQRAWATDSDDATRSLDHRRRLQALAETLPSLAFTVRSSNGLVGAQFSENGRRLLTLDANGTARLHDAIAGDVHSVLTLSRPIRHVILDPDGDRAVAMDDQGAVQIFSNLDSKPAANSLLPAGQTALMTLAPNGRQLAVVRDRTNLVVGELSARRERIRLPHPSPILVIAFGHNEGQLAVFENAQGRIWNTTSGTAISPSFPIESPPIKAQFSPDGRRVLVLTTKSMRIHDTHSGEPALRPAASAESVADACFTADGRHLLTAGTDSNVRIWDAITARLVTTLPHAESVRRIVASPDGRFVVSTTANRLLQLWETRNWTRHGPVFVLGDFNDATFSPAGNQVLVPGMDRAFRAFEPDQTNSPARCGEMLGDSAMAERWVHQLSGRHLSDDDHLKGLPLEGDAVTWTRYASGPQQRTGTEEGSSQSLVAWHEATATSAELNACWFTAVFHWEQILGLRPGHATAQRQLALARAALERAETAAARTIEPTQSIPPRNPATPADLIDLSSFYNARLDETWLPAAPGSPSNDLSSLAAGIHRFNGIAFDIRGVVQLSSRALENQGRKFRRSVKDLPVGRSARRLHFLHGAVWPALSGTSIGRYVVHYQDGLTQEVRLVFGRDLREWWASPTQQPLTTGAALAWEGSNPASRAQGLRLRLFQMVWTNPRPGVPIRHLEFESFMETSAPFLLAITVEP